MAAPMLEVPPEQTTNPPFGKVNYWREAGSTRVRSYVFLPETVLENTTTGVAIDGSGSMQGEFGRTAFMKNKVRDVAQVIVPYIAKQADRQGGTTLIYWATGDPDQLEPHGFLTAEQAATYKYDRPKNYGRATNLLPVLKYFADGNRPSDNVPFRNEGFGLFVIITDGQIEDLPAVSSYSTQLAREIEAGQRNPIKFVIIGVGEEINEEQMQELDDLDTGTELDLYFHRIAAEMSDLSEIFIELVNENMPVADQGTVKDEFGRVVKEFRDVPVPGRFEFDLPSNAKSFSFEVGGQSYTQVLP